MSNVIAFPGITTHDLDPDLVLEGAKGKLSGLLILGQEENGDFYGASSYGDVGSILILLEQCKAKVLQGIIEKD